MIDEPGTLTICAQKSFLNPYCYIFTMSRARVATLILVIGALIVPTAAAQPNLGEAQLQMDPQEADLDLCGDAAPHELEVVFSVVRSLGAFSVYDDLGVDVEVDSGPDDLSVLAGLTSFELDTEIHEDRHDAQNVRFFIYDAREKGPCQTATIEIRPIGIPPQLATYEVVSEQLKLQVRYNAAP